MAADPEGSASFALVVGLGKFRKDLQEGQKIAQQEGDKIGKALGDGATAAVEKSAKPLGARLTAIGGQASQLGSSLTWGLTVPLVAAFGGAAKAAIDFESAFTGVRKTVDATEPELAGLETGIRDMAKRLPQSAIEIAGVAEAAGALGIAVPNILGFTEVMVGLGSATNIASDVAADSLARIANVTGMQQTNFDRMGSAIVDLGNKGASTEAEIVEMATYLAAAGAQAHMSVPEILGISAAMSNVGLNAEAGGSAMGQLIQTMQVAAATGGDALKGFAQVAGMSAYEFQDAFAKDAAGALVSFIDGLSTMGDKAYTILDDLGLDGIRLIRTQLSLANANGMLASSIDTANTAWKENTALTAEVNTRNETFAAQWEIFKNRAMDLAISLGESLIPSLVKLMDAGEPILLWVAGLVQWFTQLDPSVQTAILGALALAAALGPVLFIGGKLVTTVGQAIKMFGLMSNAIKAIGNSSMLANPYVLAIVAALAGTYLIIKNWETIKQWFSSFWDWLESSASAAWKGVQNIFRKAINWIIRGWNSLRFTLPSVDVPFVGRFGGQTIGVTPIRELPMLARGGEATKGGFATVSEIAGRSEIYMPPGAQVRPLDDRVGGAPAHNDGQPIIVELVVDGRRFTQAVVRPNLIDTSRRNGRNSAAYR